MPFQLFTLSPDAKKKSKCSRYNFGDFLMFPLNFTHFPPPMEYLLPVVIVVLETIEDTAAWEG